MKTYELTYIISSQASVEEVEKSLINEHCDGKVFTEIDESKLVLELFALLSAEKDDGERVFDFENRILKEFLSSSSADALSLR